MARRRPAGRKGKGERGFLARLLGVGKPGPIEREQARRAALERQKQVAFEREYLRRDAAIAAADRREKARRELADKQAERARLVEERRTALERAALARAREKAARLEERARRLEESAAKARTATKRKGDEAKATTASKKADDLDELAGQIERHEVTPGELRDLMASGRLSLRGNPDDDGSPAIEGARENASQSAPDGQIAAPESPADSQDLEAAMRASETFHGTDREILELSERDRRVSKYLVDLGREPRVEYVADEHSRRAGGEWTHEVGDRGDLLPKSRSSLHLAWDPVENKLVIVPLVNEMELTDRGIVG